MISPTRLKIRNFVFGPDHKIFAHHIFDSSPHGSTPCPDFKTHTSQKPDQLSSQSKRQEGISFTRLKTRNFAFGPHIKIFTCEMGISLCSHVRCGTHSGGNAGLCAQRLPHEATRSVRNERSQRHVSLRQRRHCRHLLPDGTTGNPAEEGMVHLDSPCDAKN